MKLKNKIIGTLFCLFIMIIVVGIFSGILRYGRGSLADLNIISCRSNVMITVAKCSIYDHGCVNPRPLLTVVAETPGAKAHIDIVSGYYTISDGYETRVRFYLPSEYVLEKFGCEETE